mmetsp:Transcript_4648/g.10520  ORF Transcript_4648/g.10520 Transcript_4648/m.10520 type:complete len:946 (-) Transcript_4648:127-2964(-)
MVSPQLLNIPLPPGPIGVGIQRGADNHCVVSSKENNNKTATASPLEVNDAIISLNGIKLAEVEGGVNAWVILFQAFGTVERNLIVQRNIMDVRGRRRDAAKEKKTHALKDSTKHNASKKQKVDHGKNSVASKSDKSTSQNGPSMEVISLLDDSDDEDDSCDMGSGVAAKAHNNITGEGSSSNTKQEKNATTIAAPEPEVVEVSTSSASWRQASSLSSSSSRKLRGNLKDDRDYSTNHTGVEVGNNGGEEEELTIVATRGHNALADFPHSRENCVTHSFKRGDKTIHCENCYCYVCDIPVSECKMWSSHCKASHGEPRWRTERERAKRQACELALAPTQESAPAAARPVAISRSFSPFASFSSLSRSSSSTTSLVFTNNAQRVAEFSVRKLLEKITTVHPVEMQPPVGSGFTTPLRHYQKQSLAFMVDTERASKRGGWLCDEVGMGKSAVVLALVATNPASPNTLPTKKKINAMILKQHINAIADNRKGYKKKAKRIKLKTTVILTSVSLIGQWEDEVKKHAPGLVVRTFHKSRTKKKENICLSDQRHISSLNDVDVIISTSTFSWPSNITSCCEFHRVVHDESHLFGSASAKTGNANEIISPRRWGVTATPADSSSKDLESQMLFILGSESASGFSLLNETIGNFHRQPSETTCTRLVDLLKTYMVRHTKSQRINGAEALALPPSTTSTIMLTMSREEDRAFNHINSSRSNLLTHVINGVHKFTAERAFNPQMSKFLRSGEHNDLSEVASSKTNRSTGVTKEKRRYIPERLTKIEALRKDLAEHNRTEPKLRAVVFTQHLDVHDACVRGLEKDGFSVYQFTGSTDSCKRDAAIRDFQNTATRKPAVFIVTLRSGNVGITLTAASRVYLLEPALDPAVEVQAAGRIHRLGQTKNCHVVKFAFNNSYESNTIELHKKIVAGNVSIVDGFVPPEAMKILAKGLRFKLR